MSDNWITLVPEDPRLIPDEARQLRARDRFAEIAPGADAIEMKVFENVEFFDCGVNLQRILCTSCGSEIPLPWWEERLTQDYLGQAWTEPDQDHGNGFLLASYPAPCCHPQCTLHELKYEWPQGFGRFALDAMNPNIGNLEERFRKELEDILGAKLRVIFQHL